MTILILEMGLGLGLIGHALNLATTSVTMVAQDHHRSKTEFNHSSCPNTKSIVGELDQQLGVTGCRWPEGWSFTLKWDEPSTQWRLDKYVGEQVFESTLIAGDCIAVEEAVIIQLKSDLLSSGECDEGLEQELVDLDIGSEKPESGSEEPAAEPDRAPPEILTTIELDKKKRPKSFLMVGAGWSSIVNFHFTGGFRAKFPRNWETGVDFWYLQRTEALDSYDVHLLLPICLWNAPGTWNFAVCIKGSAFFRRDAQDVEFASGGIEVGSSISQRGLGVGMDIAVEWAFSDRQRIVLTPGFLVTDILGIVTPVSFSSHGGTEEPISFSLTLGWRYRLPRLRKQKRQ